MLSLGILRKDSLEFGERCGFLVGFFDWIFVGVFLLGFLGVFFWGGVGVFFLSTEFTESLG